MYTFFGTLFIKITTIFIFQLVPTATMMNIIPVQLPHAWQGANAVLWESCANYHLAIMLQPIAQVPTQFATKVMLKNGTTHVQLPRVWWAANVVLSGMDATNLLVWMLLPSAQVQTPFVTKVMLKNGTILVQLPCVWRAANVVLSGMDAANLLVWMPQHTAQVRTLSVILREFETNFKLILYS